MREGDQTQSCVTVSVQAGDTGLFRVEQIMAEMSCSRDIPLHRITENNQDSMSTAHKQDCRTGISREFNK